MMKIKNYIPLLLVIILLSLSSCSRSGISGQVVDPRGKGIEGATVKIENSDFSTLTDNEGKYLLDYIPGSFKVIFSKPGHTTYKLELNISQKSLFPAKNIIMYPIPEKEGIYYLGEDQLTTLPLYSIKTREWGQPWEKSFYQYYIAPSPQKIDDLLQIKPGLAKFIYKNDKLSKELTEFYKSELAKVVGEKELIEENVKGLMLFRLRKYNLIQDFSVRPFASTWEYKYNGIIQEKSQNMVGEENILLRTAELTPGIYAWVEMIKTLSENIRPDENKKAFVFSIPLPEEDNEKIRNLFSEYVKLAEGKSTVSKEMLNRFVHFEDGKGASELDFEEFKKELIDKNKPKIENITVLDVIPEHEENMAYVIYEGLFNGKKESKERIVYNIKGSWWLDVNAKHQENKIKIGGVGPVTE